MRIEHFKKVKYQQHPRERARADEQRGILQKPWPVYSTWDCYFYLTQDAQFVAGAIGWKSGDQPLVARCYRTPNLAKAFSLEVFYDIADALDVDPADLITASVFPDRIINVPIRLRVPGRIFWINIYINAIIIQQLQKETAHHRWTVSFWLSL